jgi:hypothetical protein
MAAKEQAMKQSTPRPATLLPAFLSACIGLWQGFPVEAAQLDDKELNQVFQQLPTRINQLVLTSVSGDNREWTAYYTWRDGDRVETNLISVRVQSHGSAEAAEQGVKANLIYKSVGWTRQEDVRGIRLYVWDTTMGSGDRALRVGPEYLFRVDNDVVNISVTGMIARKDMLGRDFFMRLVEAISDEMRAARGA